MVLMLDHTASGQNFVVLCLTGLKSGFLCAEGDVPPLNKALRCWPSCRSDPSVYSCGDDIADCYGHDEGDHDH